MYKIYTRKNGVLYEYARKILLIMRITAILLFMTMMQVSASTYGQRITINKRNASLEAVFKEIRKQSGYDFLFNRELLKEASPVNIRLTNASLEEVLKSCLSGQALEYVIGNHSVIIRAKEKGLLDRVRGFLQIAVIKGKVLNESGIPLAGATIKIIGTNLSVNTNADGEFIISGNTGMTKLSISFLGYETRIINAQGDLGNIVLQVVTAELQEVKISKGYYETTQKLNTGSVVKVTAEEIARQPLANPLQTLEGLVPGMFIRQSSGMAGSATGVIIRGRNSLNPGSSTIPFYVVDGVPFNGAPLDQQIGAGAALIGGQANGSTDPFSMINPQDIESITILKDADATAIYGSRGANGVVLITTKKGLKGKSTLNLNVSRGFGKVTNMMERVSTAQHQAIRRQAFINDGRTPTAALLPDLVLWDPSNQTDYQKMVIGNTAEVTEATGSFSGGNETTTFLFSGTYRDEGSVIMGDYAYKRGSVNMKVNHTSEDGKLKVDFSTNYALGKNNMPASDLTTLALQLPSHYPTYNADGSLYWFSSLSNPVGVLKRRYDVDNSNLFINGGLSYAILHNLNFKLRVGHNSITQDQRQLYPASSSNPVFNNVSSGLYASNNTKSYIAEPQIDYHTKIWKGKLNAILGGSWQHTLSKMPYFVQASGFSSEGLMDSYASAGTLTNRTMGSEYKYVSLFGILNYNISDKYILNGTFRRDGSSRFGPNRKFGNFGSVGAAWILSEERFIKDLNIFSLAKIRGSYGITGSDQTDNYTYMDTYSSTFAPYNSNAGLISTRVANPSFSWEENRKMEVATELGFFNDRLNLNVSYYRNRSSNMIGSVPLAPQTGFGSYIANVNGLVQNSGVELELRGTPLKTNELTWNVFFNITKAKNKLLKFPTGLASNYNTNYIEGEPLNLIRVYELTGFEDGAAQFKDRNNDGRISGGLLNDQIVAGTTDPNFYGGLSNSFRYKNLQLDVLVNFVKQKGTAVTSLPGLLGSTTADILDSQFKPTSLASSASYTSYNNYYLSSDARIVDASFIRLRNVSVSYNLPERFTKTIKVKNARIYGLGQNLATITPYKGFDPETQGITLPPLKMFTLGIQCSF
ncbi:SusC/RagA family TonB-linked outer membrane protein [Pedobacter sp. AW31-3R]|uniref:SusC/RagA family TonB-linked outer membrane protein n=1 Tax=Pedobacter sp. AW31-3R TaxID=3445781 RepID=UPI003F9FAAB5